MDVDLELSKIVEIIKKNSYKSVLTQLPDGLKPKAKEIVDVISKETGAKAYINLGSCFGACDIPNFKADLLVQWGHSEWS
ncbi:MAG: diphthamide synthesis protein [Candidatus Woesearchaeota archaeon]